MKKNKICLLIAAALLILPAVYAMTEQECFNQYSANLASADTIKDAKARSEAVAAAKQVFDDCVAQAKSQ